MADAHHMESDQIDLEGFEDDTTLFSDKEKIPIEHVNFEFEQASKLHGLYRKITIFNDTHCHQSVKNKHQRKYKYRIDIAFLDPRPFRTRVVAWNWLIAGGVLIVLAMALPLLGLVSTSSINALGLLLCLVIAGVLCLLAFFFKTRDKVYFRSEFGKIRLIELINNNPDREQFRSFINKLVMQIKRCKTAKRLNQSRLLAHELRELRRLRDETIIPNMSYEKAKQLIFRHKAFKSAD